MENTDSIMYTELPMHPWSSYWQFTWILDHFAVAEPCQCAAQTTEGYIPLTTYIMKLRLRIAKTMKQTLPCKQTGKWPLSLMPQCTVLKTKQKKAKKNPNW